ncbi:MAG: PAS domain-containing protein [Methylophaga sp.]
MSSELITSSLYWLLFGLWLVILVLYLLNLRKHHVFGGAVSILLVILAIDAFRTVFESAYFGSYFTSFYGFIPPEIYNLLSQPQFLIIPKLVNLLAACLVLFLLIRHWLPKHSFERQKLLNDVGESEKQLRQAIINSPLPTFIHCDDGRMLMTSQAVHDITGYKADEINTVDKWVQLAYRERANEMTALIARKYDGRQKFLGEFVVHTRENQQRIWAFNISPLGHDRDGRRLHLSVANDITEQRQQAAQNERMLRLLDEAQQIAHMGSWEHDLLTGKINWSEETCRIFGYRPDNCPKDFDDFMLHVYPADRPLLLQAQQSTAETGEIEAQYRIIRTGDGQIRWLFERGKPIQDENGREVSRMGMVADITDQKRLENIRDLEADVLAAVTSSQPLNAILEKVVMDIEALMPDAIASVLLLDSNSKTISESVAPNLPSEYSQAVVGEPIGPKAGSCGTAAFRKQTVIVSDIANDPLWENYRDLALGHDLRACWSQPVFDDTDKVIATFAIYHRKISSPDPIDLDTIKRIARIIAVAILKNRSEQRLRDSEQRFRKIFEQAATGVKVTTPEGRFVHANQAYCNMLGYSEAELKTLDSQTLTHPDDRQKNSENIQQLLASGQDSRIFEKRYINKAGDSVWARLSVSVQRDDKGQPEFLVGISENITEMKLAAQRQSEAERTLSQLLSNLSGFAYRCLFDEKWTMLYVSDAFEKLTGYTVAAVLNNNEIDYNSIIHHEDQARVAAEISHASANSQNFQTEYRIIRKDGEERWVLEQGSDIRDADGNISAVEGYITDISRQKAIDALIRQNEQRFQLFSKAINDAIWDWDIRTGVLMWNEAFEALFGFERGENQQTIAFWVSRIHADDRDRVAASLDRAIAEKATSWNANYRFVRNDGSNAQVMDRGYVIYDNISGEAVRMVGGITDITERLALEEQLRQSQRLEAVGQLTGGVAHDFNNLLTVIIGNADIIHQSLPEDSRLRDLAGMIEEAANRGAALTSSLLVFARRQPLDPKNININDLLSNLKTLLSRALGEEVDCQYMSAGDLWLAEVDPGLLENALLNLTLNARDAMPGGGQLVIETQNLHINEDYAQRHVISAGDYVMIAVSDSGHGIASDQLDKVFEPFYTTKSKEKGTGLGLAMVYGFIKQSRGHINIYSEIGQGTTVRLYLPRAIEAADPLPQASEGQLPSGHESILVVEDEALVREYVVAQLQLFGYQVHTAVDGQSALNLINQGIEVDLLFTDVIMPNGMSGRELADAARQVHPGLRVLFTSGYTENSIVHHGRLDSGVLLLSKPYNRDELAQKIRQALSQ